MGSIYRLVAGLVLDEKLTVFIFDAILKKTKMRHLSSGTSRAT